jgi:hypothetical protein
MIDRDEIAGGSGPVTMAERLAQIKREAQGRISDGEPREVSDEELFRQAAQGMAGRRAARSDMVGTLAWEAIAHGPARVIEESPLRAPAEDPSDLPGTGTPERTRRD